MAPGTHAWDQSSCSRCWMRVCSNHRSLAALSKGYMWLRRQNTSLVGHTEDGNLITFGSLVLTTDGGFVPKTSCSDRPEWWEPSVSKVRETIIGALSPHRPCEVLVPVQCLMGLESLHHCYHEVQGVVVVWFVVRWQWRLASVSRIRTSTA